VENNEILFDDLCSMMAKIRFHKQSSGL